jgi:hypothetical protein
MWKPEFASTISVIIPMMSKHHLEIGTIGSCPAGPPYSPALSMSGIRVYIEEFYNK